MEGNSLDDWGQNAKWMKCMCHEFPSFYIYMDWPVNTMEEKMNELIAFYRQ